MTFLIGPTVDIILTLAVAMDNLFISWNQRRQAPEEILDAAIMSGDILEVNHMLESPVVQERLHWAIGRLFHSAVFTGDIRIVNRLLEFESTQEFLFVDSLFSNCILRWAAEIGSLSICNRLLEIPSVRANVTARNSWVLLKAATNGHLSVINRLLEYTTVRDALQNDGLPILEKLASKGHLAIIDRLLEFEVIKEVVSRDDNMLLINAAEAGHFSVVNRFLEMSTIRTNAASNNNGALNTAAQQGHLSIVRRLLELSAVQEHINIGVLQNAISQGHAHIAQYIILYTTVSSCEGFKELCRNNEIVQKIWNDVANERVRLLEILSCSQNLLPTEIWAEVFHYLPSMQMPVQKENSSNQTMFELMIKKAEEYRTHRLKIN